MQRYENNSDSLQVFPVLLNLPPFLLGSELEDGHRSHYSSIPGEDNSNKQELVCWYKHVARRVIL